MKDTKIQSGIILIPDFSGFTEFVFNTKLFTGEFIVKQLLSVLIDVNDQYFDISEIEGDAILFYRYDTKPSYTKIARLLFLMRTVFNDKLKELSIALSINIDLSLKFIVHYGKFSQYSIGNFKKLYGKPIVEAHQMLKNNIAIKPSYVLYSHSFIESVSAEESVVSLKNFDFPELGTIQYF